MKKHFGIKKIMTFAIILPVLFVCVHFFAGGFGGSTEVSAAEPIEILVDSDKVVLYDVEETDDIYASKGWLQIEKDASRFYVSDENNLLATKEGVLYSKDMKKLIRYPSLKCQTSFDVPETVETIGPYAFSGCDGLHEINIGSSWNNLEEEYGSKAFYDCAARINDSADNKAYTSRDGILYLKKITRLVRYPAIRGGEYVIPSTVKAMSEGAFLNCSKLESLTLGDGIKEFDYGMLGGCTSLESFSVSEKTRILKCNEGLPSNVFQKLKYINAPDGSKYFKTYDNALYSADYETLWLVPNARESLDIHENTKKVAVNL